MCGIAECVLSKNISTTEVLEKNEMTPSNRMFIIILYKGESLLSQKTLKFYIIIVIHTFIVKLPFMFNIIYVEHFMISALGLFNLLIQNMDARNELITEYFKRGYQYKMIINILSRRHGYEVSLSHIKRLIATLGLYRRGHHSSLEDIIEFITDQIKRSGQQHGYRFMHQKCLRSGLIVPRQVVSDALSILDPVGVDLRRRRRLIRRRYYARGPNHVWHIDSYDKLKPYGICINGCIDGYSRYVIWVHAYCTNSDPSVIASYFVDSVDHLKACPTTVRFDAGTENIHIINLQKFFHDENHDVGQCYSRKEHMQYKN